MREPTHIPYLLIVNTDLGQFRRSCKGAKIFPGMLELPNIPKNGACHSHRVSAPSEVPKSAIEGCLDLEVSDF